MIETNIRLVAPGANLYLDTRCVQVAGQNLSSDLLQRACNGFRRRGGAAVPCSEGSELFVVSRQPIAPFSLQEHDWRLEVEDTGRARRLQFEELEHSALLAQLIERCLLIEVKQRTNLWTLDSPRIWYEAAPFRTMGDIAAYRRFELSAIPIESVGVGVVVEVSTAFFSTFTVADFFPRGASQYERDRLQKRFECLSERQRGQKGTLLYNTGQNKIKCYFDEFLSDVTCTTTGLIRVNGRDYDSLFTYCKQKYPDWPIKPNDPVAKVSFPGIGRPQPVVANKLFLRVMNNALPKSLKNVDKIMPQDRAELSERFWAQLEDSPLGRGRPPVQPKFWRPENSHIQRLQAPGLVFADEKIIPAPLNGNIQEYKDYYRHRLSLLQKVGCLRVPPALPRYIHVATPHGVSDEMRHRFAEDLTSRLSAWTRKPMIARELSYQTVEEAFAQLQNERHPGVVVFVFEDEDPATYFTVAYELKAWRVKRITSRTLRTKFAQMHGVENGGEARNGHASREVRNWESFIEMSALDVLQQLDCVPWTIAGPRHYEAQLAIDVGEDRRHFALSLFICREHPRQPTFWLDTVVEVKADPKKETINETQLRDTIITLFQRAQRKRLDPLRSILVLRDGRECGRELEGIAAARQDLIQLGCVEASGRVDVVDVHKRSLKGIRLWDRNGQGDVRQALEGSCTFLDKRTAVLVNTGAATLHQGTAMPIMLVAQGEGINMVNVATEVHASTHLNWSSPGKAQHLPLVLKRTDDELKNRSAQEIRRIR